MTNGDWDGAYYLSGYAMEFAFKIRVINEVVRTESLPDRKDCDTFYRHDLVQLRRLAGLEKEMDSDPGVKQAWTVILQWSEQSRYQLLRTEAEARTLIDAIEKEALPCVRSRW